MKKLNKINTATKKKSIVAAHDCSMVALSFIISYWLRLGDEFTLFDSVMIFGALVLTTTSFFTFAYFKVYQRSWRYISTHDLAALTKSVSLSLLIFFPLMFMFTRLEGIPRSVMIIDWFVALAFLGAPRFAYKMFKDKNITLEKQMIPESQKISVLLVGVNNHSELFLKDTVGNRYSNYKIVGIVDDDDAKSGQYIRDVKVFGKITDVDAVVKKLKSSNRAPQKIIIAPDLLEGNQVMHLMDTAGDLGLTVDRLPRLTDFTQTDTQTIELRPIALEDLLGRPQKALDKDSMAKFIQDKRVMITGAGGSIGSELVRQIASYEPSHICLFEISEHNLYQIDKELDEKYPELKRTAILGDIRDKYNVDSVMADQQPDIVFHAGALKHVPLSEINVCENALINVIGTKNIVDSCIENDVATMVMISTDKAVNPTSIMGATKRIAESYVQAMDQNKRNNTKFVTVRFGNVLGSTGSVIPLFQRKIAEGGPVTVTHPEMTRYFMTIREAVELIIQTSSVASKENNNESRIYVLDMGEPVLIKDLAEQIIRLSGLEPDKDIKIKYIGIRPGEKLFEDLFHGSETLIKTEMDGVFLSDTREIALPTLAKSIKRMHTVASERDINKTIETIKKLLPEYQNQDEENGKKQAA